MNWTEIQKVRKTFEIDNEAVFDYEEELKMWIVGHLPIVDLLPEGGMEFEKMDSDFYAKTESIFQSYLTECDAAEGFRLYKFKAPYVEFGRRVDEADAFFIKCINNGITYLASGNLIALRTLVLYINELTEWTCAYFDKNEMRAFALKVNKNKTNQMAGNTINMYGGSYVDVHDNEVVNLNIDKANAVSVQNNHSDAPYDNNTEGSRKRIVKELFSLVENSPWVDDITPDDIKKMLSTVLGIGETPLSGKNAVMSEELWKMLEFGRGGDRVRIVWQNIAGYLWSKKLLVAASAPKLNMEFFGDKTGSDNINKGRNGRLAELEPLLDEYVPKIKKKS